MWAEFSLGHIHIVCSSLRRWRFHFCTRIGRHRQGNMHTHFFVNLILQNDDADMCAACKKPKKIMNIDIPLFELSFGIFMISFVTYTCISNPS